MSLQPVVEVHDGKAVGAFTSQAKNVAYGNQSVEDALDILMKIGIKEVEVGKKTCNIGSDSPTTAVTFANVHTTAPSIVLTNTANPNVRTGTRDYTTTGFNVRCYFSSSSTEGVWWIAIWT